MKLRLFVAAGLALSLAGCGLKAANNTHDGDSNPGGRVVDAEDIAASSARTAWEAMQLLGAFLRLDEDKDRNPARMTSRGRSSILLSSQPLVFLDGVRLVELGLLKEMSAFHVERIEFVTGPSASIRYGTNAGNGAVVITTRSTVAVNDG
ncbi:MAG TPA: TonB-dependent receptor plug domain-containing protein [Longimicrobiales bacterium]|nr:TonB-dependent receptor plug domain-containing protein [Longimicrobiales bacterium]